VLLEDSRSSAKELRFPRTAPARCASCCRARSGPRSPISTGAAIEATTGGGLTYDLTDDTLTAHISGRSLLWYTAQEAPVSELGQGIFIGDGDGFEAYDLDGLVRAEFTGTVTDLCEVLGA
jgi:hypothetical protein